ncbi:hypothetical protein SNE40_000665 [Patella caerulea]|uniref:C3H1-type domain-containing protein n=1 Tax=Patella caerulea TaxID=87958 RepID=A0AAN8KHK2_PATCE
MSYRKDNDSFRRGSYRGRGNYNSESLKITISSEQERGRRHHDYNDKRHDNVNDRPDKWHGDRDRKQYSDWKGRDGGYRDSSRKSRIDDYKGNSYNDNWSNQGDRSYKKSDSYREYTDIRPKRKYSSEREVPSNYQNDYRRNDDYNSSSRDDPYPKRQHFEPRGGGFRGRGSFRSRGYGFRGRPFDPSFRDRYDNRGEGFRERRMNEIREQRGRRYRSKSRSPHRTSESRRKDGSSSRHRSERDGDKRNISDFISNIRNSTSPNAPTERKEHIASKEEEEIETQVIDEKLFEKMTIDQRDFIASKALGILVKKPEFRCKLSELEYDLMDIKLMFVSSELFLDFLQSFVDDDNVFEIIEPDPDSLPPKDEDEDEEKNGKPGHDKPEKVKIKTEKDLDDDNDENAEEKTDQDDEMMDKEDLTHLENIIVVARPKLTLCLKYNTNIRSCRYKCNSLHICKFHLLAKCNAPDGRVCIFTHSIHSTHNQEALRHNLLHTFSFDAVRALLTNFEFRTPSTLPPICWYYNVNKGCNKWTAENCHFIHLCQSLLEGKKSCPDGDKCKLNHDLKKNSESLMKYGMWSPEYRLEDIMKVISDTFLRSDTYANRKPERERDSSYEREQKDYYSKRGIPKPKWQLYIPSEEMWMDLAEHNHHRLESKHRAMTRATAEYEEELEAMKQYDIRDLLGKSKKDVPEISNKVLRRLVPEEAEDKKEKKKDEKPSESPEKSEETSKVPEKETEAKETNAEGDAKEQQEIKTE